MAIPQSIQSIHRAMRILYLVAGVEDGLSAAQIAARTELKLHTVYKFIRTLEMEMLLVRKHSPLRFVLGGTINELAKLNNDRQLLAIAGEELIQAQSQLIDGSFMLMELNKDVVYKRIYTDGHRPGVVIKCSDCSLPAYIRASSLLLLAYASPTQRESYYAHNAFEPEGKAQWKTMNQLEIQLKKIKDDGYCLPDFKNSNGPYYTIAAPIVSPSNEVTACVGGCMFIDSSARDKQSLVRLTISTAQAISERIGNQPVSAPDNGHRPQLRWDHIAFTA